MIKEKDLFRNRYKTNLKYICFDTETESTNLAFSRPWDISWIVVEGGQIKARFTKWPLIKDLNVSKGAAAVTGFDYHEYKNKATDPYEALELFESYLYNPEYYITGLNILKFDIYQIANLQRTLGRKKIDWSYVSRTRDVLALGRAYKMDVSYPDSLEEIPYWYYKMVNLRKRGVKASLSQLAKDFNLGYESDKHHEGMWDVIMTDKIFKQLIYKIDVF